jgi:methionine-rich copper-binding protein CopC
MKNLLALAALTLASTAACAHARLQDSTPANGSTVAAAPAELRLRFNEPVEAAMSSVKLTGPADAVVATGKVGADPADGRTLVLVLPRLASGTYRAEWGTMGRDGHHTKGEIRFTVK